MPTATATAQVNARLDVSLKAAGDAGLAAAGITPSQAVRALWQLAAEAAGPDELLAALYPKRVAAARDRAAEERRRKVELVGQGPSLAKDVFIELGLAWPPAVTPSASDLKDYAYEEKFGELMGWGW